MAAFEYSALDVHGRGRDGVLDAASAADATRMLEGRRLVPLRVAPATSGPRRGARFLGRFRGKDLTLFTRQLATLVAVAPLEEALRTIGGQSERAPVRRVVMATHARVVEGFRLSDAMACEPRAFPPLYRAMVAAGEGTGALPAILERLADLHEREQQVRGKLASALVYPAALAVTAVLVVVALMVFVVPKVVEQFESMGRGLPLLTRIVIGVSEALTTWWLPLVVLLAATAFVLARLLRRPVVRRRVDAALLRLPLLGRTQRDVHAARMARTLATMSDSGLPLIEGLAITARTLGNTVLREATESMVEAIREGGSLSSAMKRAAVFPPTLLYMATSGEDSGRLAPMLDRAADYLEREFNAFTTAAMSLLEPLIIIVLGAVVAVIVLAILLPILQFNALVAG